MEMTRWLPLPILRVAFPTAAQARETAERWRRAVRREQQLARDLIALGGLLELPDVTLADGVAVVEDRSPYQLGVAAGRRALALELLALAKIDETDLEETMEQSNDLD